jgi:hypothetical protein
MPTFIGFRLIPFVCFIQSISGFEFLFKPIKTVMQITNIAMDKVIRQKATIPPAITGPSVPLAAIPNNFPMDIN